MKKTYVLLKDLPSISAGTEFVYSHEGQYRAVTCDNNLFDFPESVIIKCPDWFGEKLEKKFTEEDMKQCFENAKVKYTKSSSHTPSVAFQHYRFVKFEDYLKTLNK